jgi:hypothetical protein
VAEESLQVRRAVAEKALVSAANRAYSGAGLPAYFSFLDDADGEIIGRASVIPKIYSCGSINEGV